MLEHKIVNNFYYVYNADGVVVFSLEILDKDNDQVVVQNNNTVYSGPISLLDIS